MSAASTSARCHPNVERGPAGRVATYDAPSASTTAAASVAMWPASARSAREPVTSQPTISSTSTDAVTASTMRSRPRSSARLAA